jgi:hypothetical protein
MRENFVNSFRVNCDANHARTFFVAQRDVSRIGWKFTGNVNFLRGSSTSELAHQFGCALRRSQNHVRIHAALESVTCVALQIQIARRPANTCRQKISGLEQNMFRRIGHTRFFATHHAADSNRTFLIRDDAIVRLE